MEDMYSIWYAPGEDVKCALFAIFDGHFGKESATFVRKHLIERIVNHEGFCSDKDEDILWAIRSGFRQTHLAMWTESQSWPKSVYGVHLSGTTASVALFKNGKIYVGHVGDSSIVLGYQREDEVLWNGRTLTKDHKPESEEEVARIEKSGGKVVNKAGVPRVVWDRPSIGFDDSGRPVRIATDTDEIPFLAISRSLGALWSYDVKLGMFAVSAEPDVMVIPVEVECNRCLILGTHGLWDVHSPQSAVVALQEEERNNYNVKVALRHSRAHRTLWINPSKSLVDRALNCYSAKGLLADNISVVTIMLDEPGRRGAKLQYQSS
jgi:protein phosphatase 1D